jgi:putative membrane protein
VIGLPAIVGLASDAGIGRFILIAALGAGLAATVALLIWLRFRYWVGEGEIIIESGVLNRQRRVIPFDRIQDIDIEQRLLARMLGLAKVRIETGGAAKDEGNLDAVSLAEAHRLRELLHRRQGSEAAPGGEPEAPDQQGEPVLFRMDGRRLLLAGLFNFSLFYLAAIFGAAFQYFDQLIEPMLGDPDRWSLPSREQAARYGVYVTLAAGSPSSC